MFSKRGIVECLYRHKQHIDQVVMKPIILMGDEGHHMNMNVFISPAAQIGRSHAGDAAREISNAFRSEVQDRQDRRYLGVKFFQHAKVNEAFPDFGGSGRLRQPLSSVSRNGD